MAKKSVRSGAPSTRTTRPARARSKQTTPAIATVTVTAQCISLMGKVCDQVVELSNAFNAHDALERFVTPEYADEAQAGITHSRAELSAMMRSLNAGVRRHIDALALATTVLHEQMSDGQARA